MQPHNRQPWFALPEMSSASSVLRVVVVANLLFMLSAAVDSGLSGFVSAYSLFLSRAPLTETSLVASVVLHYLFWRATPSAFRLFFALGLPPVITGVLFVVLGRVGAVVADNFAVSCLMSFLTAFFVCLYFDARIRRRSPALAEAKLAALQARIRPHFFFNCIGAIVHLIKRNPDLAEEALLDLSDLFRATMRSGSDFVTMDEEMDVVGKYVALEKMRFGDRLSFSLAVDPSAGKALVPRLLIQPLVENAIVHGVEPLGSGIVSVRSFVSDGRVFVVVENQYSPIIESERSSNKIAQENIMARLELLYDSGAKLESGGKGGVWRTVISFPVQEAGRGP